MSADPAVVTGAGTTTTATRSDAARTGTTTGQSPLCAHWTPLTLPGLDVGTRPSTITATRETRESVVVRRLAVAPRPPSTSLSSPHVR